jgi:trehalose 6-phosphate phosphatase
LVTDSIELANERLSRAERLWLFLDYDGTLAHFAPTPAHIETDPELVDLLTRLAQHPRIRVSVVSGRRLSHVKGLLPGPRIMLAGSYGIELQTPEGERIDRVDYGVVRPVLDELKPKWEELIGGRQGFFLEDKGWTLAIHGRRADPGEADEVLATARPMAEEAAARGSFRILGGYKFLEIGPQQANKGDAIEYLLASYPLPGALLIYLGDDDKDEEAFRVIRENGGLAILVAPEECETCAHCRLESPETARQWLEYVLASFDGNEE